MGIVAIDMNKSHKVDGTIDAYHICYIGINHVILTRDDGNQCTPSGYDLFRIKGIMSGGIEGVPSKQWIDNKERYHIKLTGDIVKCVII